MLTTEQFKKALTTEPRSEQLMKVQEALEGYWKVTVSSNPDTVVRIHALTMLIAAIDIWMSSEGANSLGSKTARSLRINAIQTMNKTAKLLRKTLRTSTGGQIAAQATQELADFIVQGPMAQTQTKANNPPPRRQWGAIKEVVQIPKATDPPPWKKSTPAAHGALLQGTNRPDPLTLEQQKQQTNKSITAARAKLLGTAFGQHLLTELTKRRLQVRSIDSDDLLTMAAELPAIQMAAITSKHILKVDNLWGERKQAAAQEGMRILCNMLGSNPSLAKAFLEREFAVIVVPKDKLMTQIKEFSKLGDKKTFDGRMWKDVRGVGYVGEHSDGSCPDEYKGKVCVAVTEENLTGTQITIATEKALEVYDCGYSTTLHEFAHTIDRFALTDAQRKLIDTIFNKKRADAAGNILTIKHTKKYLTGPEETTTVLFEGDVSKVSEILARDWSDGKRTSVKSASVPYNLSVCNSNSQHRAHVQAKFLPRENYASSHRQEYFAQLVCAYFDGNVGKDSATQWPRNNGRAWIEANEPREMLDLLDELFGHGRFPMSDLNPIKKV